jgi:hypothetical protein
LNRIITAVAAAVVASVLTASLIIAFLGLVPGSIVTRTVEKPVVFTQTLRQNITVTKTLTIQRDVSGPVWEMVFVELRREPKDGVIGVYNVTVGKGRGGVALVLVVKAPDGFIYAKTVNGFVFKLEAEVPKKALVLLSEASTPVLPGMNRTNYRDILVEKGFNPANILPYQNPRRIDVSPGPYSLIKERGMYQPYDWLAIWPISIYFHGLDDTELKLKITFSYSLVEGS